MRRPKSQRREAAGRVCQRARDGPLPGEKKKAPRTPACPDKLSMAEASSSPQRPFGSLPGLPPDGRRTMGEDAFHKAALGAAKRRPKLPCQSALAY
eukprot:12308564-Alexandrium_andersonii.AAC.1